jgi:hypothetical protein
MDSMDFKNVKWLDVTPEGIQGSSDLNVLHRPTGNLQVRSQLTGLSISFGHRVHFRGQKLKIRKK